LSDFFDDLMESVEQMDEIVRGERQPSRTLMRTELPDELHPEASEEANTDG
jgi:hypothetical protein